MIDPNEEFCEYGNCSQGSQFVGSFCNLDVCKCDCHMTHNTYKESNKKLDKMFMDNFENNTNKEELKIKSTESCGYSMKPTSKLEVISTNKEEDPTCLQCYIGKCEESESQRNIRLGGSNEVSQLVFSLPKHNPQEDNFTLYNRESEEVLKINKEGFFYKGERVEDIHNVYERFNEWLTGARKVANLEDYLGGSVEANMEGWEDKFNWKFQEMSEFGEFYITGAPEDIKSFISQLLLEQKIEHCSEPLCPECDMKAYNRGRDDERERIVKLIKEKGMHLGYKNDIISIINNIFKHGE